MVKKSEKWKTFKLTPGTTGYRLRLLRGRRIVGQLFCYPSPNWEVNIEHGEENGRKFKGVHIKKMPVESADLPNGGQCQNLMEYPDQDRNLKIMDCIERGEDDICPVCYQTLRLAGLPGTIYFHDFAADEPVVHDLIMELVGAGIHEVQYDRFVRALKRRC